MSVKCKHCGAEIVRRLQYGTWMHPRNGGVFRYCELYAEPADEQEPESIGDMIVDMVEDEQDTQT